MRYQLSPSGSPKNRTAVTIEHFLLREYTAYIESEENLTKLTNLYHVRAIKLIEDKHEVYFIY